MPKQKDTKKSPKQSKKSVSENVLKKITSGKIHPKPRWHYLLKDYTLWGSFALVVLVGGISCSLIIFRLTTHEWEFYHYLNGRSFPLILQAMPYFWILLLAVFVWIAYYNFRHTKKGYKYSFSAVVGLSVLASAVLGFAFYGIGLASTIDQRALEKIPLYQRLEGNPRLNIWREEAEGLVAGKIIELTDEDTIMVISIQGKEYIVEISRSPRIPLFEGMMIGIFGEKVDENKIEAEIIRPLKGNLPPLRNFVKENPRPPRTR